MVNRKPKSKKCKSIFLIRNNPPKNDLKKNNTINENNHY